MHLVSAANHWSTHSLLQTHLREKLPDGKSVTEKKGVATELRVLEAVSYLQTEINSIRRIIRRENMSRLYRYSMIFHSLGTYMPSDFAEILWMSCFLTLQQVNSFTTVRVLVSQTSCVQVVLCLYLFDRESLAFKRQLSGFLKTPEVFGPESKKSFLRDKIMLQL